MFFPVHTVPADPELAEAPRVLGGRGALSIRPPAVSANETFPVPADPGTAHGAGSAS